MKVFANREIRNLFQAVLAVWTVALALTQGIIWHTMHAFSFALLLVFLLLGGCLWGVLFRYFQRQSALLEQAVQQIQSCLDGNPDARLDCDREGELYRLFHSVNALAAVLSAHADNEQREKHFLKNTIADISHQLKTPLAALNIYNGLLQDEAVSPSEVKEFADLSEQELDRIETLVQNLLKITRLDAGSVVLEKKNENVAEMVQDIARQYNYRAEQEQKKLVLSGSEAVTLWCDRDWMQEAVDNLVKNALDHTKSGDTIQVEWNALPSMVQIKVRDNGSGIHPEDLYHICDFYFRVYNRIAQDIKVPFKLNGADRIDDTPLHKALREALANALIHADYYDRRGLVIQKWPDKIRIANPGAFRINVQEALVGGVSDPRNESLIKMFNLINVGERAGSGLPSIRSVWQKQGWQVPEIVEAFNPDRTTLTLPLSAAKMAVKSGGKKVAALLNIAKRTFYST